MEIQERISRQRVMHIVESYELEGQDIDEFKVYLADLLDTFAHPLIELGLVDGLVQAWSDIPMQKGIPFLTQVHEKLKRWQTEPVETRVTPDRFEQITGLDPVLIFDAEGAVLPQPMPSQGAPESL
jgi:hypothetical protein